MMSNTKRTHHADRLLAHAGLVEVGPAGFTHRGRWAERFRERQGDRFDGRVVVEIGCSDGGLIAAAAARWPGAGFVGIDWKAGSLADAADRVAAAGLNNVLLVRGRGQDLCRMFADGEAGQVWLFHPEPCDREAERANRLVNVPFLLDVHRVLVAAGRFVLKTDHAEYYQHTLGLLDDTAIAMKIETLVTSADFWNDPAAQASAAGYAFAGEVTAYEARYRRKRLPIHYVELAKRNVER